MPVERPSVANADTDSKSISKNDIPSSVMSKQNVVNKIHVQPRTMMASDLNTWSSAILLPMMVTLVRPLMADLMALIKIVKVVTLIPLPVDPGEEPIKAITMMSKSVASCS